MNNAKRKKEDSNYKITRYYHSEGNPIEIKSGKTIFNQDYGEKKEEEMKRTDREERLLIEELVKDIDKDMENESYRKYTSRELEV